jgi:hypothetical protein
MTPVAGANWGGHLVPRPGQEVLVAFQNGNIDRPIIVGTAYNGSGSTDAQGNRIGSGTMQASANAPAFFAGKEAEAHTHNASLSGLKSQQLNTSRSGQGGYNQLVFDDTPGESRIELGTTEYQSALQLGHLKQQTDNARQADRGHGGELATQASLALRAGNGLLLSADARPNASSTHLDSREPIAQTQDAKSLSQSLAEVAAKQNAALRGDPQADKLPAIDSLQHAEEVMSATASQGSPGGQGHGEASRLPWAVSAPFPPGPNPASRSPPQPASPWSLPRTISWLPARTSRSPPGRTPTSSPRAITASSSRMALRSSRSAKPTTNKNPIRKPASTCTPPAGKSACKARAAKLPPPPTRK